MIFRKSSEQSKWLLNYFMTLPYEYAEHQLRKPPDRYISGSVIFSLVVIGFLYQILIRISKILICSYYKKIHGIDPLNLDILHLDPPVSQVFTSSLDDKKDFMVFDPDANTIILDNGGSTHISNDKKNV